MGKAIGKGGGYKGREAKEAAVMSSAKNIPHECWDLVGPCVRACMCLQHVFT